MKKILLWVAGAVVVLTLLVGGFFAFNYYIYEEKQSDIPQSKTRGLVTAIDVSAMAYDGPGKIFITSLDTNTEVVIEVPSVGLAACAAKDMIADISAIAVGDGVEISGDLLETGAVVPCTSAEHYLRVTGIYRDPQLGFRFEYPKASFDGYILSTPPHGNEEALDFEEAVILTHKSDYDSMLTSTDAREGPPTISILVYANTKKQTARAWANAQKAISNINLATSEISETSLSGAKGIRYNTDGLYPAEVLVVTQHSYVYVLSATYVDDFSPTKEDFIPFLKTVAFTPIQ
jgi:hypothetical protein